MSGYVVFDRVTGKVQSDWVYETKEQAQEWMVNMMMRGVPLGRLEVLPNLTEKDFKTMMQNL